MKNKVILITGGSGSLGKAMTKRLLELDVKEVRIFSRDESKQVAMRRLFNDNKKIKFIIGDITHFREINRSLEGVDYCIHAAANKYVDICEAQPLTAIDINVIGSRNVMFACDKNKVNKLVMLSTDKAANAETTYGSTKFLMERMGLSMFKGHTDIIITRYGNVIGSEGSVVPHWLTLKEEGKPITITDRSMTRFFMSIDEAVELVLYALEKGEHQDLFIYENKGCTIGELADAISDNQVITGMRGIEKTGEALLTVNELNHSERTPLGYRVNSQITSKVEYTEPFTSSNCVKITKKELKEIIDKL